jgi:glycerol-3-phosphate O-acyltransferase/dihydroxyacetone phosphate acyltransferase
MASIPVERPQDIAKDGIGTVTITKMAVTGTTTQFTKQIQPKDQLKVNGQLHRVQSVEDDFHLTLKHPTEADDETETEVDTVDATFKIFPHIDHKDLYAAVFARLKKGEVVGIFPEGGSHDNSALLPFKAGLAMLALGAMAEGAPPVRLIPVGLTYMHGHRFRSRAMVDFGAPIDIPERYVEMFRQGGAQRFQACDEVLALTQSAIESVTITAPDYDTMKVLWVSCLLLSRLSLLIMLCQAARRLYKPEDLDLTLEQTQQLTIRFSEAYTAMMDEPRVQALRQHVADYNHALLSAGMRDHEVVATTVIEPQELLLGAFFRSILVVLETVILLPFMVLGVPILGACRLVASNKAREAAAKSSVKLIGRDVMATWKLLTALVVVPVMLLIYSLAAGVLINPRLGGVCWCLLPVIMLGSLHLWDHYIDTIKAIRGMVVALRSRERGIKLYKQRWQLKTQIRSLAAEAADRFELPRMFDEVDFAGEVAPEDL